MRINWRPPKTHLDNKEHLEVLIKLEYDFRKDMTKLFLQHGIDFCDQDSSRCDIEFMFCTETRKFQVIDAGYENPEKVNKLMQAVEVSHYFA